MTEKEFTALIDVSKYQVFIFDSTIRILFVTLLHPWFVLNKKGDIFRYEIRKTLNPDKKLGHLHINNEKPYKSLRFSQKVKVLKSITGDEGSLAKKIIDFVENSSTTYPLLNKYSLWNANCGTYVKWVMDHFPEVEIKYPYL